MDAPDYLVDWLADDRYWLCFGNLMCKSCGALIENHQFARELHGDWHEKLRKAVDETGSLG